MSVRAAYIPGWADVLEDHAVEQETARRLIGQLGACEASALAFCRLLERWARGEPEPATPGRRQAALRRAADRAETALAGLEGPLGRYLLELEADQAEDGRGTARRGLRSCSSGSRFSTAPVSTRATSASLRRTSSSPSSSEPWRGSPT